MVLMLNFGQLPDFFFFAVVGGHREAMIGHVKGKIASHDPQPDQSDIASLICVITRHVYFPPVIF